MPGHSARVIAPELQRYLDRIESGLDAEQLASRIALGSVARDEAELIVRALMALKHGPRRTCKRGHPWTPENRKPNGTGGTRCRVCELAANRRRRKTLGPKKRCTECGRIRGYFKTEGPCPQCRGERLPPGPRKVAA